MGDFKLTNGADGPGYKAKVDDHGRLYVVNNHVSHQSHHSSYHKNYYSNEFETTLSGATETICAYLSNETTKDAELYYIHLSSDADIEIFLFGNTPVTSGGDVSTSYNMNLGSGKTEALTCLEGGATPNIVLSTVNKRKAGTYFVAGHTTFIVNQEGGIIITPGKDFSISAIGALNQKVKVTLTYSFHTEGAKL